MFSTQHSLAMGRAKLLWPDPTSSNFFPTTDLLSEDLLRPYL